MKAPPLLIIFVFKDYNVFSNSFFMLTKPEMFSFHVEANLPPLESQPWGGKQNRTEKHYDDMATVVGGYEATPYHGPY